MKITNETKVGALAIVAITFLILGFNFLKGNKLFTKSMTIHAKYANIQGLATSNPVFINGLKVGNVASISSDKNMREIVATLNIESDINIPNNSVALIIPNPLATTKVDIRLGDAPTFLKEKDFINTEASKGLLDDVLQKVDPVLFEVKNVATSLDSLIESVSNILNKKMQNNISDAIDNLNKITASVLVSANSLQSLLDKNNGAITSTLKNTSSFTGNLAANNEKITALINNLNKTTGNLAAMDFKNTLNMLDSTINNLKTSLSKINSTEGSLGLLINYQNLYKNLTAPSYKITLLLDDIRIHPKRYVSISLFGKKVKTEPLSTTITDSTYKP